ncbi:hypothetical protein M0804_015248 [Polistes exclamans]|nr:hypothetical protein M0804_015248 [Polistes exclamans]
MSMDVQHRLKDVNSLVAVGGRYQTKLDELLYLNGSRCFTRQVLYRKLVEFFGEDIYVTHQQGCKTVIFYECSSMKNSNAV